MTKSRRSRRRRRSSGRPRPRRRSATSAGPRASTADGTTTGAGTAPSATRRATAHARRAVRSITTAVHVPRTVRSTGNPRRVTTMATTTEKCASCGVTEECRVVPIDPIRPEVEWDKPLTSSLTDPGRLHGTVVILGALFHAEAVEVMREDDDLVTVHGEDHLLNDVADLVGDVPATVEIQGKEYVLVISPFGE